MYQHKNHSQVQYYKTTTQHIVLFTILVGTAVQKKAPARLLNVILDSGGTSNMINQKPLPKGCITGVIYKLLDLKKLREILILP